MSALPRYILLPPAEFALKCMQTSRFGSKIIGLTSFRQSLDPKNKALLDIYQGLGIGGYRLAGMFLLSENSFLDEYTKRISDMLHDDVILQLALLAWHFDAALLSKELLEFFAHPHEKAEAVCNRLWGPYTSQTGKKMPYYSFREKLLDTLGFVEYLVGNDTINVLM